MPVVTAGCTIAIGGSTMMAFCAMDCAAKAKKPASARLYKPVIFIIFLLIPIGADGRRHHRNRWRDAEGILRHGLRREGKEASQRQTVQTCNFHNISPNSGMTRRSRSEERRVGKECRSRWSP